MIGDVLAGAVGVERRIFRSIIPHAPGAAGWQELRAFRFRGRLSNIRVFYL
jgi:hypothetical protein